MGGEEVRAGDYSVFGLRTVRMDREDGVNGRRVV